MSRPNVRVLFLLVGAVLLFCTAALAKRPKTITIFSDAVLPSGQELKAGEYQVDVNESSQVLTFKRNDKVVATTGYTVVEKPGKNDSNEARFGKKDNRRELQELRFTGESRTLLIAGGAS